MNERRHTPEANRVAPCLRNPDRRRGYALLFVLFLTALVLIAAATAALNIYTEGQREKDKMMIWRGEQYERAIGLYYRKYGRFPTSIDDLLKEQNGNVRFLREAYKEPMNKTDGSWRLIYVTPAGQLIGSVRYTSLQQMAFLDKQREMGIPTPAPASGNSFGGDDNSSFGSSSGANSQNGFGNSGLNPPAAPQIPGQPAQVPSRRSFFPQPLQMPSGAGSFGISEQSSSMDNSGQVIGGFIIGVGGKENTPSIVVYNGGTTYKQWEFIFNPLEQVQTIGAVSTGPQTNPAGTQPITNPMMPPPQPQIPQQP